MADVLSEEEIGTRLDGSELKREGEHIVRDWEFKDFRGAMAYHSAGGVTDTYFSMASQIDRLG